MEVVATLLVFAALVAAWFLIVRSMKRKNVNIILRHILGATVGVLTMIVVATIFIAAGLIENRSGEEKEAVVATTTDVRAQSKSMVAAEQTTPQIVQDEPKNQAVARAQAADLGFTSEQFYASFNQALAPLEMPFKAPAKPVITAGSVNDSFMFMLDDYIGITGSVSKHNDMVNSLMLTGTGDGTPDSGARIMLTSVAMFMAATNDLSESGKRAATETLLRLFEKQESSEDLVAKTYRSGLQFMVASPEGLGTWFTVSPTK